MSNNIKIKSIDDKREEEMDNKMIEKKPGKLKKMFKYIFIFLLTVIIGGASGIFADRFLFPYLATTSLFNKYECFKPRETEIIVQEKEIVKIEESNTIHEAINKVKSSVVSIVKDSDNNESQPLEYGSGFIITSDGLIATNNQVINNNQTKYSVFTQDGRNYAVDIIHLDSASNLIFLKIKADNLPVVSLGVSEDLKLGQKIISLGYNAKDFQNYASMGIINSLNSAIIDNVNNEKVNQMIIVDSEINSINSGGPVIDLSGKVVGINIKEKRSGDIINYVLPIDFIKKPLDNVIKINKIGRVKLGIKYIEVTPYLVKQKKLSKDYGIYLLNDDSIIINSPADKAGLEKNDLIYAINDIEINKNNKLVQILEDYKLGDEVEIKYIRNNQEASLQLKLGE